MNNAQKIERSARIERLVNDEDLEQAFADTRQAIFEAIESTPLRDDEGLKCLRLQLKCLADLQANLRRAINDGKLEAEEVRIANMQDERKKRNIFGR